MVRWLAGGRSLLWQSKLESASCVSSPRDGRMVEWSDGVDATVAAGEAEALETLSRNSSGWISQ